MFFCEIFVNFATMKRFCLVISLLFVLALCSLFVGAVEISFADVWNVLTGRATSDEARTIVIGIRMPQMLTALFCGAGTAVSGLLLQTAFRNPLAGPGVFGIGSGASLAVALLMLLPTSAMAGGWLSCSVLLAAFVGAMAVTMLVLFLSRFMKDDAILLIAGLMVGYLASSLITLLNFWATAEGVRRFTLWGMGDFSNVSLQRFPLFALLITIGLLASCLLVKPMNVMQLGDRYAESLGFSARTQRRCMLLVSGWLTAVGTAYCGPIAFLGMAVPHLARFVLQTENHRTLLPMTMLIGAVVALVCQIICQISFAHGTIPLNAVTPFFGAPIVLFYLLKKGRNW